MTAAANGDRVTVSTTVAVSPQDAFAVFTEQIGAWWRKGPRFRFRRDREPTMRFVAEAGEALGVGARLLETYDEAPGDPTLVGRVLVWSPGERLVFEWRGNHFTPDQVTEVDVRFEATSEGTRITLEHRGWEVLPADHAARHGLVGPAFTNMIGLWWGDQLVSLGRRAAGRP